MPGLTACAGWNSFATCAQPAGGSAVTSATVPAGTFACMSGPTSTAPARVRASAAAWRRCPTKLISLGPAVSSAASPVSRRSRRDTSLWRMPHPAAAATAARGCGPVQAKKRGLPALIDRSIRHYPLTARPLSRPLRSTKPAPCARRQRGRVTPPPPASSAQALRLVLCLLILNGTDQFRRKPISWRYDRRGPSVSDGCSVRHHFQPGGNLEESADAVNRGAARSRPLHRPRSGGSFLPRNHTPE